MESLGHLPSSVYSLGFCSLLRCLLGKPSRLGDTSSVRPPRSLRAVPRQKRYLSADVLELRQSLGLLSLRPESGVETQVQVEPWLRLEDHQPHGSGCG